MIDYGGETASESIMFFKPQSKKGNSDLINLIF